MTASRPDVQISDPFPLGQYRVSDPDLHFVATLRVDRKHLCETQQKAQVVHRWLNGLTSQAGSRLSYVGAPLVPACVRPLVRLVATFCFRQSMCLR